MKYFFLFLCFFLTNNAFAQKNTNICQTNNVIANGFRDAVPVNLPFSSNSKIEYKSVLSFSSFSKKLLDKLSKNNADYVSFGSAIRLPDICDITVFISTFVDEGEYDNYGLNVFRNGKGDSVNFGTGSEFWIDKNYSIKVKSYDNKLVKISYYKISNEGKIIKLKEIVK